MTREWSEKARVTSMNEKPVATPWNTRAFKLHLCVIDARGRHQNWMLKCNNGVEQVGELRDVLEVDV
eukprot:3720795-Amphidinium_carterae.1